jgi:hypothetical protein
MTLVLGHKIVLLPRQQNQGFQKISFWDLFHLHKICIILISIKKDLFHFTTIKKGDPMKSGRP